MCEHVPHVAPIHIGRIGDDRSHDFENWVPRERFLYLDGGERWPDPLLLFGCSYRKPRSTNKRSEAEETIEGSFEN